MSLAKIKEMHGLLLAKAAQKPDVLVTDAALRAQVGKLLELIGPLQFELLEQIRAIVDSASFSAKQKQLKKLRDENALLTTIRDFWLEKVA